MGEISEETKRPATSPFWKALEDSFGRNVTQHEWEIRLGDEYPLIHKSFLAQATKDNNLPDGIILAPTEWYSDIDVFPMQRDDDPPLAEKHTCFLGWDLRFLCKSIARGFALVTKFAETSFPATWQISELSDLPVLLTIQHDEITFHLVVSQLVAKLNQPFVLLSPTRRFFNVTAVELLSRRNAGFFDLESQLSILPNGLLEARKSGGKLFSPYLPEQKAAISENEAVRLFALFERLKLETNYRKASLHEVFTLLVLNKLSQTAAAEKLKCSEATISARVKEIEKRMGNPIETLRNSASEIRERFIEKDPRAKKQYLKGLVDDTKSKKAGGGNDDDDDMN